MLVDGNPPQRITQIFIYTKVWTIYVSRTLHFSAFFRFSTSFGSGHQCKEAHFCPTPAPLHSTPLECRGLDIPMSIDISRRWREEPLACQERAALLQRSNMSIENNVSILALQRSAMSEKLSKV